MVPCKYEEFSIKGAEGGGVRPYWNEKATSDQLGRTVFKSVLQGHMQHVTEIWASLYQYLAKGSKYCE